MRTAAIIGEESILRISTLRCRQRRRFVRSPIRLADHLREILDRCAKKQVKRSHSRSYPDDGKRTEAENIAPGFRSFEGFSPYAFAARPLASVGSILRHFPLPFRLRGDNIGLCIRSTKRSDKRTFEEAQSKAFSSRFFGSILRFFRMFSASMRFAFRKRIGQYGGARRKASMTIRQPFSSMPS